MRKGPTEHDHLDQVRKTISTIKLFHNPIDVRTIIDVRLPAECISQQFLSQAAVELRFSFDELLSKLVDR